LIDFDPWWVCFGGAEGENHGTSKEFVEYKNRNCLQEGQLYSPIMWVPRETVNIGLTHKWCIIQMTKLFQV